jgi:hypothetical protein
VIAKGEPALALTAESKEADALAAAQPAALLDVRSLTAADNALTVGGLAMDPLQATRSDVIHVEIVAGGSGAGAAGAGVGDIPPTDPASKKDDDAASRRYSQGAQLGMSVGAGVGHPSEIAMVSFHQ